LGAGPARILNLNYIFSIFELKPKTMKKQITFALIAVSVLALSFKLAIDKTSATVEQIDGLQVFLYSKPANKYDISGSIKAPFIEKENVESRIKVLIEKAKKEYPSAEGIIINNTLKNAEVIRFKE
jgi:hypothetical protein